VDLIVRSPWLRRLVDVIQAQALSPPPLTEVFRRLDGVGPPQTSLEKRYFSLLVSEFGAKNLPAVTRPLIDDYIKTRMIGAKDREAHSGAELAEKARVLIEEEFVALRSAGDLSRRIGVNRVALERAFRCRFNMSVRTYITRLRIEYASKLLMTSDLKTAAIANEIGFHDRASFSVAYRRLTGISPSKARAVFRDQHANKKDQKYNTKPLDDPHTSR
jgi:AraC-like DNA-binding protein